ncbi:MAG: tRNA 2-thiouridine(34) synthase MnmA [Clostridia bacterium]|nr:tRNA 2-thiouridine(34) synthase MnmA [Clostridia bacterium]
MCKRILVGMSGGIDSTWAAKRLVEEGWTVEGAVLDMHSSSPVEQARLAADSLGIPLHIIDCRKRFKESVEDYFVSEYANGRTPNPCVVCNGEVKIKLLADTARNLGIEKISTGHYVRIVKNSETGRFEMYSAEDKKKDQSYFLWRVAQEDWAMFHSTLERAEKESVKRELSEGEISHDGKESQEICFIPDGFRVQFLRERMCDEERLRSFTEGDFVTLDGKMVGRHSGLANYTLGQRKGLGIALGRPAYVLGLDGNTNRVTVGFEEDNVRHGFAVSELRFVSLDAFEGNIECLVRVRHRGILREATASVVGDRCTVSLKSPEKTVSPGQSAVFYDADGKVLFGGVIN